jgi:hypothetical protein
MALHDFRKIGQQLHRIAMCAFSMMGIFDDRLHGRRFILREQFSRLPMKS